MKLQLYVLRQIVVAFTFAVAGLMFVALPGIAVSAVHRLPNTDTMILLRYLPIVLQNLSPYVLPICFLLAVVACYGRLAADREWTAIQMAGVRPLSLLKLPLLLGIAMGVGTYWMLSSELPQIKRREKSFLIAAATSAISNLAPGRTSLQLGGFYLDAAFRDGDIFRDVIIYRPSSTDDEDFKAFAGSARLSIEDEVLYIDLTEVEPIGPDMTWTAQMGRMVVTVPLNEFVREQDYDFGSPRYLTSSEILASLASPDLEPYHVPGLLYEYHKRFATSFTFLLFLLLGMPTGLLLRRGTQLGALAIAVGYALVYYILSMRLGKELGRGGVVPPAVGAWATNALGLAFSLYLMPKALRR